MRLPHAKTAHNLHMQLLTETLAAAQHTLLLLLLLLLLLVPR